MAKKPARAVNVGEKIRQMREKLKLDYGQLAEKTGYQAEYLEEIEAGTVVPPVGTLIQISRALALDSSSLLSEDRKVERRKSYLKRTKAYSYKCLTPDAQDKHLWAYLVTLDPEKIHEMVAYKHEGEEFMFVIEGHVEVKVGDEVHELKKGKNLHFDSGKPHLLKNLSPKATKLLVVVYTP
ncbi:MAG: cupin domain-containing protein [Deltaproteobacteria bacterium]|nr:cupin domain-containing protein [Deltaproteobacteria bacterium]